MVVRALPCRYVIVCPTLYHTCILLEGAVCQALNFNLTDITMKGVIRPSEISLTGHSDKGNLEVTVTAHETEILSVERPEDSFDLDAQCPAGYTWEQMGAKFMALDKLIPEDMDKREAQRINNLICPIRGPLDQYMEAEG